MNDTALSAIVACCFVVGAVAGAFTIGMKAHESKIATHCQNYGKFVVQERLYECKEAGVAK